MDGKIRWHVEPVLRESECSTLRIVHLQSQLADYLARVEVAD
jgi:hypothetical protein